jgi:hypothetical protein
LTVKPTLWSKTVYGVEKSAAASRIIKATPAARPNDRASKSPTNTAGHRASLRATVDSTSVSGIVAVVIVFTCAMTLQKGRQRSADY